MGFENLGEIITKRDISMMQLVASIQGADGRLIPVNVLPDTGASHNVVERKAAIRAGLTGLDCKYRGHGTWGPCDGAPGHMWGDDLG